MPLVLVKGPALAGSAIGGSRASPRRSELALCLLPPPQAARTSSGTSRTAARGPSGGLVAGVRRSEQAHGESPKAKQRGRRGHVASWKRRQDRVRWTGRKGNVSRPRQVARGALRSCGGVEVGGDARSADRRREHGKPSPPGGRAQEGQHQSASLAGQRGQNAEQAREGGIAPVHPAAGGRRGYQVRGDHRPGVHLHPGRRRPAGQGGTVRQSAQRCAVTPEGLE